MFLQTTIETFLLQLIEDLISPTFLFKVFLFILCAFIIFFVQFLIIAILTRAKKLSADLINGIRLIVRLAMGIILIMLMTGLFGLPAEVTFFIGALFTAIVSFSSAQVIQNFVAGFYLLFTRPFIVGDLIAIGDVEGIVVDISLNYTRLRTPDALYQLYPNRNIIGTSIVNYNQKISRKSFIKFQRQQTGHVSDVLTKSRQVRYTFDWGVPIGNLEDDKNKIDQICQKYEPIFGEKPKFFLVKISHRLKFKFVITTDVGEKIIDFVNDFRNDLVTAFH